MKHVSKPQSRLRSWAVPISLALHSAALILSNLTTTLQASDVNFVWWANTEPDLAGYRLYCYTDSQPDPVVTDVGSVTSYTILDLPSAETCHFYLTAYNLSGLESDPSEIVTITIPPEGLPPNSLISFLWQPNSETDLAGYRLYCHDQTQAQPTVVDVGNVLTHTISDIAPGRTYDFYLTAYNQSGLESDPSTVLRIVVPFEGLPPTTVRLTSEGPEFTWAATEGLAYQIQYKDDMAEADWKELITITAATNPQVFRDYSRGSDNRPLVTSNPRRFYRIVELP